MGKNQLFLSALSYEEIWSRIARFEDLCEDNAKDRATQKKSTGFFNESNTGKQLL